jgi:hypothetical protein
MFYFPCDFTLASRVLLQRLRINEVYADHDRLRSGFVSRPRFDAGLDLLGLSLAKPEINALAVKYAKPADPALINWKAFQYDVESVESDNAIIYTPTRYIIYCLYLVHAVIFDFCQSHHELRRHGQAISHGSQAHS